MVREMGTERRGDKNRSQFCIITRKGFLSRHFSIQEIPVYFFVPHRTWIFYNCCCFMCAFLTQSVGYSILIILLATSFGHHQANILLCQTEYIYNFILSLYSNTTECALP